MKLSQHLLPAAILVGALGLGACSGGTVIDTAAGQQNAPQAPTNQPDENLVGGSGSGTGAELSEENEHGGGNTGGNGGNGGNPSSESDIPGHGEKAEHEQSDRRGGGEPIPEPTTFLLLGSGLAATAYYRRRKNGQDDDAAAADQA